MSVHLSTLDRAAWFAAPVALALVMSAAPASAQSRIETTRRAPGAQLMDSTERQLRRLQGQFDSLFRIMGSSDDLSAAERRRVESELSRTAQRIDELMARSNAELLRLRGSGIAPIGAARSAAAMSRALMQVNEVAPGNPRGWLGIVVEGSGYLPRIENGELIVRYASYPEIVSVDPSSPAQRAGLAPRDTLVAYDGRDVRENDISFTRLLRPNARVLVRVRRDGRARDIPVTIAEAPQRIVVRRDELVRDRDGFVIALGEGPSFPARSAPMAPPSSGALRASVRPPVSQGGGTPTAPTVAAPPSRPGFVYSFSNSGVAGASLTTITPGLATALGVASGVLVTAAPVGSPAHESGLIDGDVITKVTGQAVRSVAQVRQLVALAWEDGERAVELEIVRGKKVHRATLRW